MMPGASGNSASADAADPAGASAAVSATSSGAPGGGHPGNTVIVNYLPSSIGNSDLKKLFESVGPTVNAVVVRDRVTKESKCFGFVSYETPGDAERAVEVLNGRLIQDKCIRVGIAIPQQELGHTGKLYVSGFPAYWNDNELMAAFKPYGRILSSRVLIDPTTGLSKCSGFVNFESYSCAEEAAKELQGREVDKHQLKIKLNKPGGDAQGGGGYGGVSGGAGGSGGGGGHTEENPADCNLMVNFLPSAFTDENLQDLFSTVGQLRNWKIVRTPEGESKCFGFVTYQTPQDAAKAIVNLSGRQIQANCTFKKLKVQFAKPEVAENGKLYIGNLPENYVQTDLDKLFENFGPVKESKLLIDKRTGKSKACGFVELCSGPLADLAISELNGMLLDGASQPLKVHRPLPPKGAVPQGLPVAAAAAPASQMMMMKQEAMHAHTPYPGRPFGLPAPDGPAGLLSPPNKKRRTDAAEEALTAAVAAQEKGEFALFVYGLGDAAQDIDLWELFGPHGAVKSVRVVRDAATQKPKGYGFVTMLKYSEAVDAVRKVNGHLLGEKRLQVRFK